MTASKMQLLQAKQNFLVLVLVFLIYLFFAVPYPLDIQNSSLHCISNNILFVLWGICRTNLEIRIRVVFMSLFETVFSSFHLFLGLSFVSPVSPF